MFGRVSHFADILAIYMPFKYLYTQLIYWGHSTTWLAELIYVKQQLWTASTEVLVMV